MAKTLNVGLIGYKFMGKAHSNAYRQVDRFYEGLGNQARPQSDLRARRGRCQTRRRGHGLGKL